MDVSDLIQAIRADADCTVLPVAGQPFIKEAHFLPEDVRLFYTLCGGIVFFESSDYCLRIVLPDHFVLANPIIVGAQYEEDISASWYIVAASRNKDYITIDLSRERLGLCYDSFWDRHGVAGSCPIIAMSFTELLNRIYANRGDYWYWLKPDFSSLGDAYEDASKE